MPRSIFENTHIFCAITILHHTPAFRFSIFNFSFVFSSLIPHFITFIPNPNSIFLMCIQNSNRINENRPDPINITSNNFTFLIVFGYIPWFIIYERTHTFPTISISKSPLSMCITVLIFSFILVS